MGKRKASRKSSNKASASSPKKKPKKVEKPEEPESETESEEEEVVNEWWKQVYLCGCEWDHYDKVFTDFEWEFEGLRKLFAPKGEVDQTEFNVFVHGGTEPAFIEVKKGKREMVAVPVFVVTLAPIMLPNKVGVKSVMMPEEKIASMREYKMEWLPFQDYRDEEAVGPKRRRVKKPTPIHILKSLERRTVLSNLSKDFLCSHDPRRLSVRKLRATLRAFLDDVDDDNALLDEYPDEEIDELTKEQLYQAMMTIDRNKYENCDKCQYCKQRILNEERKCRTNYCHPYIFLPHRLPADDDSTEVTFFADVEKNNISVEFDWEMESKKEYVLQIVEDFKLTDAGKKEFKELLTKKINEEKAKIAKKKEMKEKELARFSPQQLAELKNTKMIKFYPSNLTDESIKNPYINRYFGKADKVV